jgi:benzoyl-CoA reductase/2-hydroxyglutaryl-CoA dehydratase subunit BcrC/BadD/HgdB
VRFLGYSGSHQISHYCGYASDFISMVKEDQSVDGAVFPRSCDSTRSMAGYLAGCGKFTHQLHIPPRQDEPAAVFFAERLKVYRKSVEAFFGEPLEDMRWRAATIEDRNRRIAGMYNDLVNFPYSEYLENIHRMFGLPLHQQFVKAPARSHCPGGKRVFLVGSLLSDIRLIQTMEKAGLQVVGDNIPESKRLFSAAPIESEKDIYLSIARSVLRGRLSPTQGDFYSILLADWDEIKRKEVVGVVFATQKYCEPYDFLFPVYKEMLKEHGIPILRVVFSGTEDNQRLSLAIETFAATL